MKQIPLTQGKFALVDDEDYERLVAMGKWYFGAGAYAIRWVTTYDSTGKRIKKTILMHRIIMGVENKYEVDHRYGDTLDNRKLNLRVCTKAENGQNRGKNKNNTSGFKGVWRSGTSRWRCRICVNRTHIHVGYYESLESAAKAYNAAALKYHGEFAKLNEI